ncbi:MAG: cell division protein SepF [Clostridia bacterium]|nr:cell division protein SepF [Clostridia bacterium]
MGFKDYFKGILNVDDDEFETEEMLEEEETQQSFEKETSVKREPIIRRYTYDRKTKGEDDSTGMRVVLCKPDVFNDVAPIADHLRQGKTVVLNLETTERETSRRVVDFLSGAAYALSCKLKKVANNTFIIVPNSTDISGELLLDDFGEENYFI